MTACHVDVPYPHMAFKIEVKANQKTKVKKASEELNYQLKESKVITMLSGTSHCGIHPLRGRQKNQVCPDVKK